MSLKVMQRIFSFVLVAGMLLGFVAPAGAQTSLGTAQKAPLLSAEKVEGLVLDEIEANGQTDFFVWMSVKADLSKAETLRTKAEKGQYVFDTVRATAEQTQKDLRSYLDELGVTYRPYYIVNAIFVEGGNLDLAMQVASRTDVSAITANHKYQLQEPFDMVPAGPVSPDAVEPNLTFINVDDAWAMGAMGQGTVMAGNDTGLEATHPAIAPHYRGCIDPPACTTWDHNYNWWDAWDWSPLVPADDYGHGTHTTGTMVGDDGGDNKIGVAPGAQTVHCKNMSGGGGDDAHFLECFEWDLAPWDLTGNNPLPEMAPDAVNNSWGYGGGGVDSFRTAILTLQAAGIAVEVSAGNEGPSCQTLRSPGDYTEVLTTGSVDHVGQTFPGVVTSFSSRGPSSLDGNYFPDIMAPGNSIRSSVYASSYEYWSGTSMAGPHATALVGLIWSACPAMTGMVDQTFELIKETAAPLTGQNGSSCGGDYTVGPNNDWGVGTIDAEAAVALAIAMCSGVGTLEGTVTDAISGTPIENAKVVADWDGGGSWTKYTDENGFYNVTVPEGEYVVTGSHPMYTEDSVLATVITDTTTVADIELTPRGRLFGYVTDFDSSMALEGATVTADDGTSATTDADGFYEMYLDEGIFDVEATLENYAPGYATVDILSGEDTQQDFILKGAIAFTPAPVLITLDMGDAGIMLDATLINRQPWDYDFEFGEKDEGFIPVLAGMQTVTIPAKTAPAGTATSGATVPERSFNVPAVRPMAAPNVLLVAADDDVYGGSPIQAELLAYGDLGMVDLFNAISGTPTLPQLEAYDVVVVWANYVFANPTGMGDVLADYVDGGGKVIDMNFAIDPSWGFSGRWVTENYTAIKGAGTNYVDSCLGVFDAGHPIMAGVTNVCDIYRQGGSYLTPDSTEVALWGDGEYFVAVKDNLPVVTLNTYMGVYDYYGDQEDLVLHNAILWLAEGGTGVPWLGEDPISSTVPASSTVPGELDVTLYFTATADVGVTQPGDYLATLKVNGDPSMDVPVVMTVNAPATWGKIFGNVSSQGYCDANPYPLEEAIVYMETNLGNVYSATTDAMGDYQLWMDEAESPVDVSVDFPEHIGGMVEDVVVDGGVETEVNFELRWNHPCVGVTPDSFSAILEWGDYSTQVMELSNGGAAGLDFELKEINKGWMPAINIPAFTGTLPEDTRPKSVGPAPKTELSGEKVAPLNLPLAGPQAFAMDVYPGYNLVEFPDLEVPGTWNIIANIPGNQYFAGDFIGGDFSTLWVIDYGTLSLYAVDTATGAVTMIGPSTPYGGEAWTGMTGANDGTMYASSTNISRSTLYTVDLGTGTATVVGEITNAPAIIDIAINAQGEMFGVDIVNGVLVQIDPATGAGTVVGSLGVSPNYAQGMDFDEETGILYWAAYTTQGELRIIDTATGNSALVGAFSGGAEVDSFAVATGGAGVDVPWLSEDVISGTIPADGGLQTVNVTMDSSVVDQPGEYYATLAVKSNDPINKTVNVPVTMTVIPADDMGKLTGMVWDNCTEEPLGDVLVSIDGGVPITMTYTDDDGMYTAWLVDGTYMASFSLDGYWIYETEVTIVAGEDTVIDVALIPYKPCIVVDPTMLEVWVLTNTAVYTDQAGIDISNIGGEDLEFKILEREGGYAPEYPAKAAAPLPAVTNPGSSSVLETPAMFGTAQFDARSPDAWTYATPYPMGIVRYAKVQCPDDTNSFYIIGGVADGSIVTDLNRYDADTDTWTTLSPIPYTYEGNGGVCYDGKIYSNSGGDVGFYIYDIATDVWTAGTNPPRIAAGAAFAAWDGYVYMVGGDDDFYPGSGVSDAVNIYDIATNTWIGTGASMPTGVSNMGFVQLGAYLYIAGGWNISFPSNSTTTQRYDIEADTWEVGAAYTGAKADMPMAGTSQYLYTMGGDSDGGGYWDSSNSVWRYDFTAWPGGAWEDTGDPLPETIQAHNGGFTTDSVVGGEVWSVGGLNGSTFMWTNANLWREAEPPFSGAPIDVPWIWEVPITGTVPAQDMLNIEIYFTSQYTDATPMPLGIYTATLNISSNGGGQKVPVTMHVVEEYIIPEASFEADAEVCVDAELVFSNTTTVGIPPITWYEWDFGDGITSTEENPVHVFTAAGPYTVTLEACNSEGCTEFSQAVEVLPKPEASFTFAADLLEVTFTNTSMYGDTFLWDFGDGITSTEESPVHVFAAEGTYMVTLWVYNDCGVAMFEAEVSVIEGYFYWLPLQFKAIPDEP